MNRPFLRLACQETSSRWYQLSEKDHQKHGKMMFQRALVDAIVDEQTELIQIQKPNRKNNPIEADFDDFEINLDSFERCSENYRILSKETRIKIDWNEEHRKRYEKLWQKYHTTGAKLAEGLTCLQTAMQVLIILIQFNSFLKLL